MAKNPSAGASAERLAADLSHSVDDRAAFVYVAGLPPLNQVEPCPDVGTVVDGRIVGDVNCDGDANVVDALFILLHVAALPLNLPDGCSSIGPVSTVAISATAKTTASFPGDEGLLP